MYPGYPVLFALFAGLFLKSLGRRPVACCSCFFFFLEKLKCTLSDPGFSGGFDLWREYLSAGLDYCLSEAVYRACLVCFRLGGGLGWRAGEVNEVRARVGVPAPLSLV